MKIAVLGAGAWGSALAIAFARYHEVTLWSIDAQQVQEMRTTFRNDRYLPNASFPSHIVFTDNLAEACAEVEVCIIVTPIIGLRPTLEKIKALNFTNMPILWACKGFEANSGLLPHQVVAEILPSFDKVGVLSGPSFAKEVAEGLPAALTLASRNFDFAKEMAVALHSPTMRLYAHDDVIGVQVGGAAKNVMAIATGICDGLGLGLNSRAALMTRGLAEITRLTVKLGGHSQTMLGLSGVGDLILTCTGALSRNRQVGLKLAEGLELAQILTDLGHVAEGVPTTIEVSALADRLGLEMPITKAVCNLLQGRSKVEGIVHLLMQRDPKVEF